MSELVIRDGINYGKMAVVMVEGIEFVVGVHHLQYLPGECVEVPAEEGRFQEFRKELLIEFEVSDFLRGRCYAFRKEDVTPLCERLSKTTTVLVSAECRVLALYKGGQLVSRNQLSDFYYNITQKQIDETSF